MTTLAQPDADWRIWPVGYGLELSDGEWESALHLEELGAAIAETVATNGRLIVTMPPRHGKSELVDVWTPVWFLDLWPHKRIILATYSDGFAGDWGGKVRDAIQRNKARLRVRVRQDNTAKNSWKTTAGGGFYAVGVGGGITGKGGHLVIIDDPHKDWAEANSEVMRKRIWDWWIATIYTRLEPGAAVIVVMTRWHEDDFVGKLLKAATEDWRVVNFPALAEPNDALGRPVGAALWPKRYTTSDLVLRRKVLGPHVFGGLYQQHPSAPEGQILKRASWRWYDRLPPGGMDQWLGSWDMNFGETTDEPDYVVGQVWARKGVNRYLVWQVRGRWDFTETRKQVRALNERFPQVNQWVVEKKANGPAIISSLRNEVAGLMGYNPVDSKEARAQACAPGLDAGNVWLPQHTVWETGVPGDIPTSPQDLVDEGAAFPHGVNDDQVDAFTQASLHMGVASPILKDQTYRDDRASGRR